MASLVGIFAVSHGPLIAREWETMPRDHRDKLEAGFDEVGRRLKACKPDVLVVVSPDHWVNFFINNLPAVCIGIGDEHDGPPEPFMKKVYPHERLKGHQAFGRHLLQTALDNDFEPALSHRLRLDHGTCIPLWRIGVSPDLPLVPILVNDLEEPMPSIRRCLAWGRLHPARGGKLRRAVAGGRARHRRLEPLHRGANDGVDRREVRSRLHRAFRERRRSKARRLSHARIAAHGQRCSRNAGLGDRACCSRQHRL